MRVSIPSQTRSRFEAERHAQARREQFWDRAATAILGAVLVAVIIFWAAVVYIAMHFILKVW